MEDFRNFKLLAHAALRKFKFNIACYYGSRETATVPPVDRYYVAVMGMGLPTEGFTVGHTSPVAAVDAMVRRLKEHRRQAEAAQLARDLARRAVVVAELND